MKKKKKNKAEFRCFIREELGHFYKGLPRLNGPKKEKELTTSNTDDSYGNLSTLLYVFQSPC